MFTLKAGYRRMRNGSLTGGQQKKEELRTEVVLSQNIPNRTQEGRVGKKMSGRGKIKMSLTHIQRGNRPTAAGKRKGKKKKGPRGFFILQVVSVGTLQHKAKIDPQRVNADATTWRVKRNLATKGTSPLRLV